MAENKKSIEDTVVGAYKSIENKFTEKFLTEDGELKTGKMEETVVGTYKKIEDGVVGAYKKIENKFVDKFMNKDE